jgi:hypothetical protein
MEISVATGRETVLPESQVMHKIAQINLVFSAIRSVETILCAAARSAMLMIDEVVSQSLHLDVPGRACERIYDGKEAHKLVRAA